MLERLLTRAWVRRGLLAWLLFPVAVLFGILAALRRGMFQVGLRKTRRLPIPVLVVGNVVVGGSGKTPVVVALVRHLQAQGLRVGVISRGYGRLTRDCREVMESSAVQDVGDEPALIRRSTAAPVFVAPRRFDAGSALLTHYPDTDIIVCDDGLQHLALHRDLEICVFDDRGLGNGFLLPAGPLREPWPRHADLVLHTGSRPAFDGFVAQRALAPDAVAADGRRVSLSTLVHHSGKPLLALAGIARPEQFFAMLRAQGLHLERTLALPDHYSFDSWVRTEYERNTLICTEKDAVKLWAHQPEALAVPLLFFPEPAFFAELDRRLNPLLSRRLARTVSSQHGHTTT